MRRPATTLTLCLTLAACGGAQTADYPALVPVDTLLNDAPVGPDPAPSLEARAAALRAEADALRRLQP